MPVPAIKSYLCRFVCCVKCQVTVWLILFFAVLVLATIVPDRMAQQQQQSDCVTVTVAPNQVFYRLQASCLGLFSLLYKKVLCLTQGWRRGVKFQNFVTAVVSIFVVCLHRNKTEFDSCSVAEPEPVELKLF